MKTEVYKHGLIRVKNEEGDKACHYLRYMQLITLRNRMERNGSICRTQKIYRRKHSTECGRIQLAYEGSIRISLIVLGKNGLRDFLSATFVVARSRWWSDVAISPDQSAGSCLLIAAAINKVPGGGKNPFSLRARCRRRRQRPYRDARAADGGGGEGGGSGGGGGGEYKRKGAKEARLHSRWGL